MMKDRLVLAKELLAEHGVIFVSIDDNEQAYLKVLMDDIFGEEHFIANIIFNKTSQGTTLGDGFKRTHEHILTYSLTKKYTINNEKVNDPAKYKYEDKIGKYATTNKLNSINSYLPENKNRGYTIYYNEKTSDIKIRYEYDKKTLIYNKKYDSNLISQNYVAIRPGLRKTKQTV